MTPAPEPAGDGTGHAPGAGARGQAQIELIACVPVIILVALAILQLLSVGYAQSLADGAAEAGAIAVADGREPRDAVVASLPGWAEQRTEIGISDGVVRVALDPPALLPGLAAHLTIDSKAWVWSAER